MGRAPTVRNGLGRRKRCLFVYFAKWTLQISESAVRVSNCHFRNDIRNFRKVWVGNNAPKVVERKRVGNKQRYKSTGRGGDRTGPSRAGYTGSPPWLIIIKHTAHPVATDDVSDKSSQRNVLMVRGNVLMVIGLAGRRMGKSLCVACPADLNPDSRIADLISTESQAVLIPRILPPEKSGRSVGPLFSRSATHVGKVPQSCLGKLLQSFRARPFRRSRKLHFIQTIRRFGRHVYL